MTLLKSIRRLFSRKPKQIPELVLPEVNEVDLATMDIGPQMQLIRNWERQVYQLFKVGNVLEVTQDNIHFMLLTNAETNTYFGSTLMPSGTKFIVKEQPAMNEGGFYHAVVLLMDGREALVDIYELYHRVKQVG